jgi:hypothetical protein
MRFRFLLAALAIAASLGAVEVKNTPADYPVQGAAADFAFGAEYMANTFTAEGQWITVDDHLVIEIGVFPKGEANIDLRRFTLRINGKVLLLTQTPGMVAASLKYPDWNSKPVMIANAGPIIVGRPPAVERFPGDRREQRRGPGQVVEDGGPKVDYGALIGNAGLPEGKRIRPAAGFLYFPYDKKLKGIRTVELLVDDSVVKLR